MTAAVVESSRQVEYISEIERSLSMSLTEVDKEECIKLGISYVN